MAKRKRLTPARAGYLDMSVKDDAPTSPGILSGRAPIAQVAGNASAHQALNELSDALETARARGLMMVELPLSSIDAEHLVRDRVDHNAEEMTALVDSMRARGQQTPIEVVELKTPSGQYSHGLVSGWRRLLALKTLHAEAGGVGFDTVKAIVLATDSAQDAYVSMVEENEMRVNLSFYERARIVQRTLKEGVYPSQKAALQGLFGNVPRAKRSKIGSFMTIVRALDGVLLHPAAISEKLGLALAQRLAADPSFEQVLKSELADAPRETPKAEVSLLNAALSKGQKKALNPVSGSDLSRSGVRTRQVAQDISMLFSGAEKRVELQGDGVDDSLARELEAWLRRR